MKKITNKNEKSDTYSANEMKRYLGALSEQHSENLKAIKEGFQVMNRKLDENTEILGKHSKKLDSHSEMLGILMEDVTILKEDVSVLKEDMSIVKKELKRKVDYDEFIPVTKRVQKLEAKI